MQIKSLETSSRYAHVDAMRALAALLVVWLHVAERFEPLSGSGQWIGEVASRASFGKLGVYLFFIISGFVIPASFPKGHRLDGVRVFLTRRFFRLYPAFWLAVPISLWAMWLVITNPFPTPLVILANLTMVPSAFGQPRIGGVFWTLEVELLFYAVCLAAYVLGLLHRPWFLVAAAMCFTGLFAAYYFVEYGMVAKLPLSYARTFLGYLAIMFIGAALRTVHDGRLSGRAWIHLLAVIGFWLLLPSMALLRHAPTTRDWAYTSYEVSTAVALVLFVILCFWIKITFRWAAWLGRVSYSLYLFHPVVLFPALWMVTRLPVLQGFNLGLYVVVCAAVAIGVSAAIYAIVEEPAIRLGKSLSLSPERMADATAIRAPGS